MKNIFNKKIIKKEISLLHFLFLLTSKLAIGVGIGLSFSDFALPYSYPLIMLGTLILLPTLNYLMKEERNEVKSLNKRMN